MFPYRTQKLSPFALMVLGWRRPGRVGRCRILKSREICSFLSFCCGNLLLLYLSYSDICRYMEYYIDAVYNLFLVFNCFYCDTFPFICSFFFLLHVRSYNLFSRNRIKMLFFRRKYSIINCYDS